MELRSANSSRLKLWHENAKREWIASDWSNAAAGEMGECCNAVKKLQRIRDGLFNINEEARQLTSEDEAIKFVGKEAADTIIYLDLLLLYLGVNLDNFIVEVFNKKSEEYGFPQKLNK